MYFGESIFKALVQKGIIVFSELFQLSSKVHKPIYVLLFRFIAQLLEFSVHCDYRKCIPKEKLSSSCWDSYRSWTSLIRVRVLCF